MIDRKTLIERLRLVQRALCCYDSFGFRKEDYGPPDMCDCKFGGSEIQRGLKVGEETCCPEMRQTIWILERMTDEEYNRFTSI